MTIDRETVIRLAREADCNIETERVIGISGLQRFATLVLEHGRKPLTEEQIEAIQKTCLSLLDLVRAVEAAHGITNKESSDAE